MALVLSELDFGYNPADATSYVLNSIGPAANSHLWLLYYIRHSAGGPGVTPPNTYGGTWAELGGGEQTDGTSSDIGAWELQCSGTPGTSAMTVPVDAATLAVGFGWSIIQATGHDPSGTTLNFVYGPIGTTSGVATCTLAAASDPNNGEVFFTGMRGNTAITPEAGFTGGTGIGGIGPTNQNRAQWKVGSFDTTPSSTFTSVRWQCFGFEVKVLGGGTPATPSTFRRNRQNVMIGKR
jgi:hypothetical protein